MDSMIFTYKYKLCHRNRYRLYTDIDIDYNIGCAWGVLGVCLGVPWVCLGCAWGMLGCAWRVPGYAWRMLGCAWGVPGRAWGVLRWLACVWRDGPLGVDPSVTPSLCCCMSSSCACGCRLWRGHVLQTLRQAEFNCFTPPRTCVDFTQPVTWRDVGNACTLFCRSGVWRVPSLMWPSQQAVLDRETANALTWVSQKKQHPGAMHFTTSNNFCPHPWLSQTKALCRHP